MQRSCLLTAAVSSLVLSAFAGAAPSVPGIGMYHYGDFSAGYLPYALSLGADGSLYAGCGDNNVAGVILRKIPSGGGPSVAITNTPIYDPDGVLVDAAGDFSGIPGAVLAASSGFVGETGVIRAVKPDGTVVDVVGPADVLNNNDTMAFDSAKNLCIDVIGNRTIVKFSGLTPQTVINLPAGVGGGVIAVDDADRLWVACSDGNLRRYGANHALQATIAVGAADPALGYCAGGVFAKGVYTVNRATGVLYRVTAGDALVQVGTGFPDGYALAFDAAGNLFCVGYNSGQVFRSGCVADLNADGLVDDSDFSIFVVAYDLLDCADPTMPSGCGSDLNADGFVDDADFSLFAVAYDALLCS